MGLVSVVVNSLSVHTFISRLDYTGNVVVGLTKPAREVVPGSCLSSSTELYVIRVLQSERGSPSGQT
jgi:hypothetical protein